MRETRRVFPAEVLEAPVVGRARSDNVPARPVVKRGYASSQVQPYGVWAAADSSHVHPAGADTAAPSARAIAGSTRTVRTRMRLRTAYRRFIGSPFFRLPGPHRCHA